MIAVNIDVHVSFAPGLGEEGGKTDVERRLNDVGDEGGVTCKIQSEGGVTFGKQCDQQERQDPG